MGRVCVAGCLAARSSGRLGRVAVGSGEGPQAEMLLGAGRAAGQVGSHAWNLPVGIRAGELQVDVAVQLIKAGFAAELRLTWTE